MQESNKYFPYIEHHYKPLNPLLTYPLIWLIRGAFNDVKVKGLDNLKDVPMLYETKDEVVVSDKWLLSRYANHIRHLL